MDTETQRAGRERAVGEQPQEACPSCRAALVDGMRFCRMCGYRLGEGMAEYVETVRFDRMAGMAGVPHGEQGLSAAGAQTTVISPLPTAQPQGLTQGGQRRRKGRKLMLFLLLLVVLIPVGAVGIMFTFTAIRDAAQQGVSRFQPPPEEPYSFLGASEFADTEGEAGALLERAMPGSPAERAGLLDGDIITKLDGKPVGSGDALREALRQTPIGKTVEVEYVRDGETKTAMLTTISNKDYDSDAFVPKERGLLGIEIDDAERVAVEGTKMHGVRLGDVYDNRPADLAGLKEGDIIVEFDGKPVRTTEGLSGYINLAKPASTVSVVIYRNGERIVIPVKMGRRN